MHGTPENDFEYGHQNKMLNIIVLQKVLGEASVGTCILNSNVLSWFQKRPVGLCVKHNA